MIAFTICNRPNIKIFNSNPNYGRKLAKTSKVTPTSHLIQFSLIDVKRKRHTSHCIQTLILICKYVFDFNVAFYVFVLLLYFVVFIMCVFMLK